MGELHLRAAAFSFHVLTLVLTTGFIVSLVRQEGPTELWSGLCAVAAVSLIGAYAVLSRRS